MKVTLCFTCLLMAQAVPTPKPKSFHTATGQESLAESDTFSFVESKQAALMAQTLVNKQCEDAQMVKEVGPIVKTLSDFWQKENGYTMYPWALTMLGALRWGGVSLFEQNRSEVIDHDLDFLIQMPNVDIEAARGKVQAWREYLTKTTGLETMDVTSDFMNAARLPNMHDWDALHSEHFFIIVKKRTALGDKLVDSHFENSFFDRVHHRDPVKVPDLANPLKLQQNGLKMVEKLQLNYAKQQFQDMVRGSETYREHFTMVDLWIKVDPLGEAFQAKPQTNLFFMGSTFPFPNDPEVIHKDILGVYKPGDKIHDTKSLCELREPNDLFPDDLKKSPEMTKLVHTCGKSLSDNGYESFQYCDSHAGSFFQRAHKLVMGTLGK